MKFGFVSAILCELSFEEVIRFASETGYECVEIMCWPTGSADRRYGGVTHLDAEGFTRQDAAIVNELLSKNGIEISGLGYYPNPMVADHDEAQVYIEHIKQVIDASALLGVNQINTFIGRDHTKSVQDNWPRFEQIWPDIVRFAEAQNVRIGIEN